MSIYSNRTRKIIQMAAGSNLPPVCPTGNVEPMDEDTNLITQYNEEYSDISSVLDSLYVPDFLDDSEQRISELQEMDVYSEETLTDVELVNSQLEQELVQQKKKRKVFNLPDKVFRKRARNPDSWKKKKNAIARERGQSYISYNGKIKPAKEAQLGLLCRNTCKLKCSDKFTIPERSTILSEFYQLDVNSKNMLLFKSIKPKPVARHRKGAKKPKRNTFKYYITINKEDRNVCKSAFSAIFQITNKKIEVIQDKFGTNSSSPSQDNRGKHSGRPHKLREEVEEAIIAHILKFPAEQSHYSRNKNPHKKYLSPELNLSKMYRLYIDECKTLNRPIHFLIKECSYSKMFSSKFNLSFGQPRSDTCATCDAGDNSQEHIDNYKFSFDQQKTDRELARTDRSTCYVTMDLQQTMPLPKITTSVSFYLRQLWFYNFGIHVVKTEGESSLFLNWTEDEASRGSVEIWSSFYTFVQNFNFGSCDRLVVWSDSCAGQNKNITMIYMYQLLVYTKKFRSVDHKFPVVGHSYLDSDRDFGRVEKILRKKEQIFTAEQYRDVLREASPKNTKVIAMSDHFRDIENLPKNLGGLTNRKKNVLGQVVPFRDGVRWVRVEEYGSYLYKQTIDPFTPFLKLDLQKKRRLAGDINISLKRARPANKVSEEKKSDLRKQLKYVPEEHRWFYNTVLDKNN